MDAIQSKRKTCAIMQPAYLPWAGFFNLISEAHAFVYLDDAQFTTGDKHSWQNRNRILVQGKELMLTVPAIRTHLEQPFIGIIADDKHKWRKKHLQSIRQAYARAPYLDQVLSVVEPVLQNSNDNLCEITICLIRDFSERLGLKPEFYRSSAMEIPGERTARLVAICRSLQCDEYFSPGRAQEYIEADGDFVGSGISVRYQNFVPQPYPQLYTDTFVSHLSIVDIVASIGFQEAARYVAARH